MFNRTLDETAADDSNALLNARARSLRRGALALIRKQFGQVYYLLIPVFFDHNSIGLDEYGAGSR